jgi:hypothetical protein
MSKTWQRITLAALVLSVSGAVRVPAGVVLVTSKTALAPDAFDRNGGMETIMNVVSAKTEMMQLVPPAGDPRSAPSSGKEWARGSYTIRREDRHPRVK